MLIPISLLSQKQSSLRTGWADTSFTKYIGALNIILLNVYSGYLSGKKQVGYKLYIQNCPSNTWVAITQHNYIIPAWHPVGEKRAVRSMIGGPSSRQLVTIRSKTRFLKRCVLQQEASLEGQGHGNVWLEKAEQYFWRGRVLSRCLKICISLHTAWPPTRWCRSSLKWRCEGNLG
jgi:hypothetical protein